MTSLRRHRLALAVFLSLLLHLLLLSSPGWHVPTLDDLLRPESAPQLDAQLAPVRSLVAPAAQAPVPERAPAPRRHVLTRPAQPMEPEVTVAAAPAEPAATPLAEPVPAPLLQEEPPRPPEVAPAPEFALPRRGSIRFVVSRGDQGFVIGKSLHRWRHDGNTYTLSNLTETTGLAAFFRPVQVTQTSEGDITGEGLRPRRFRTEKNGDAGDAASFDWATMRLALSAGNPHEVALQPGAQDMLSMFYQLGAVLPWVPGEAKGVMVATGKKFERYAFEAVGEETLATKTGVFRTLHVRTAAGVEAIDIWAGLDLRGLPLKIRYTDRQGESFDQIAEEIAVEGMPGAAGGR